MTAVISAACAQQAGDELPAGLGQLVLRAGLEERVAVALEQRQVGVHARARGASVNGLGMNDA